jgi:hypothetical protein
MNMRSGTWNVRSLYKTGSIEEAWFNEGCSKLLDERKQTKLHWLQEPCEINEDNLNNVKHEAGRCFKKKRENI